MIQHTEPSAGLRKKSFRMYFGGSEIWFEHLDGIHADTALAIQKLEQDCEQFKRPSFPSLFACNLAETAVDAALIKAISEKLLSGEKRFMRVVFVGADKTVRKKLRDMLAEAPFALHFTDDFEKAKEWLVGR